MRFSLIALFLLSLIVAVVSGYSSRSRVRAQWFGRSYDSPKYDSRNLQPTYHQHNAFNHNVGYSSGGTHSYPASFGSSGNSYSGNVQNLNPKISSGVNPFARLPRYRYSSTAKPHYSAKSGSGDVHSYPASTGNSGNTNSVNARQTYHQQPNVVHTRHSPRTEVHHRYHYNPPHQISYGSTFHPVYQGHPPVYVYRYRDSGSRFDNLLTGLALYNLGRNSHSHHYSSDRQYSSSAGEICKLGISKGLGDYEETRIDCNLISSFIWEDTTSTTRNKQQTSGTVKDALKMKGPSIKVTPGMICSMIRTFRDTTTMRRSVDCGLLQEYARTMFDEGLPITQSTSNPEVDPFRHFTFTGGFVHSSSAKVNHNAYQHYLVLKNASTHYNVGAVYQHYNGSKHHNVDQHNFVLKNGSKPHFVNLTNLFLQEYARSLFNRSENGQVPQSTTNPEVNPTGRFVNPSSSKVHHYVDQRHLVMKNSVNTGNMHQNENAKSYISVDGALLELRHLPGWFNSSSSQLHLNAKSGLNSSNVLQSENANSSSADDAIRHSAGRNSSFKLFVYKS